MREGVHCRSTSFYFCLCDRLNTDNKKPQLSRKQAQAPEESFVAGHREDLTRSVTTVAPQVLWPL